MKIQKKWLKLIKSEKLYKIKNGSKIENVEKNRQHYKIGKIHQNRKMEK